ncbi:hypothetical protein [Desmospora profundinema]|uniref:Uncharacterized protein n=1 Tax=Desmospora profundinema TaxID=1571184 RepID=A0ABU1IKD7_9BACL|nr:hypothetical protein [Desmospora profundinema]MDR6225236.1 hypothetical protein [Desmospora profundinema]
MKSIRFPRAGLMLGGYEWEEQQRRPFVALDLETEEEVEAAVSWLSDLNQSGGTWRLIIRPSEGDLFVRLEQNGASVAEGEVWGDESWTIFRSFLEQENLIWLMVSRHGNVIPDLFHAIDGDVLEWKGNE